MDRQPVLEAQVTARAVWIGVEAARRLGVDPERLLTPLGTTMGALADPELQVSLRWVAHVWTEAPRLADDPAFGLHAAELAVGMRGHVLDYVATLCACPRDYFTASARYQRLLISKSDMRLVEGGDRARFEAGARPTDRPPPMDDFVFAQLVLRLRPRSSAGFPLRRVAFEHRAPSSPSIRDEYTRVFQAPVEFAAPLDLLEFDRSYLDAPLADADPTLVAILRSHADRQLTKIPGGSAPEGPVTRSLVDAIETVGLVTMPDVEIMAKRLGQSSRSLQRRLGEEGTSYREVIDRLRHREALRYLGDPRYSVTDVSFLLGFAEVSAFSRAFRRWTGETAASWRREHARREGQASRRP